MSDVMTFQVAMEASAMPPPASKANPGETDYAGDASFDRVLEKAMKPEESPEALALATEGVVNPMSAQDRQPENSGSEAQSSDPQASAISPAQNVIAEGQVETVQTVITAVVDPSAKVPQPAAADQIVPGSTIEADSPLVISEKPGAEQTPYLDSILLTQAETGIAIDYSRSSQPADSVPSDAHETQKAQTPAENAQNIEHSRLTLTAKPQDGFMVDSEGNYKAIVETSKDKTVPSKAENSEASAQPKSDGNAAGESITSDIQADSAKALSATGKNIDAAVVSTSERENLSPEVKTQEGKATAEHLVSESRKVKVNINNLQGESPPQEAANIGAVQYQELDVQVKEPARLAEARSPEVISQVTKGIDLLSRSERQTLRIQLHPENLGKIEIRLSSGSEGVTVKLNTDTPATGILLERSLSELRTSLADAGVNLASLSVNSGQQQAAYQEASHKFAEKATWKTYYKQNNADNGDTPSEKSDWKESAIDYRI